MILAHHGFGEELAIYAVAAGSGAGSALLVVCRFHAGRLARWLRRR